MEVKTAGALRKLHPRACNDDDEEAVYDSHIYFGPGFKSGAGDSVDANLMAPHLLVTKSSTPSSARLPLT